MDKEAKEYAVHVRRVSKTFGEGVGEIRALREVDFDTRVGELMMIVGPSGSGKTTLLSVIAGTLKFDTGEVDVLGRSFKEMSDQEITDFRKKHIGFIFQQFHLIKTLTNWENVSVPLLLNGWSRERAKVKSFEALANVGLKGREYGRPRDLSGGQQQRVAIARALVHDPQLIICDEPTASLDAETGSHILELMKEAVKTPGRSVIVVTHDSRIFKYADRIVKMDDGMVSGNLTSSKDLHKATE